MGLQFTFENYVLDAQTRELRCNKALRPVEPQVFDLLHFLIENRERVVSRDEIFRTVWRGRIVSDSVLGTRINAVRQAIGDDGTQQRLIRTIRGTGFRFVGHVPACIPPASLPAITPTHRLAVTLKDGPAVAVLPFGCIDDQGHGRAIAAALSEEVVAALCGIDWLPVVSGRSLAERAEPARCQDAASRLRASYGLCGSVRLEGNQARVVVRLIDAASGVHLWVDRFCLPVSASLAAQEEIALKVAGAVGDQVFATESIRARRKSPEALGAWETIVRVLDLINSRNMQKAALAQTVLRKAIESNPKSSTAFGLLSFVATLGVHQGWRSRQAARSLAIGAAERATALDDEDPWGHLAAGYARLWVANQPAEAIEILQHALSLNPNLSMAHYLIALASTFIRKHDDAFRHADLAERLKARDLLARGNAGAHDNVRATASFVAGRHGEGIAFALKAIAQSPRQTSAYRSLVTNSAHAGEVGQATRALQMVERLAPEYRKFFSQSENLYIDKSDYKKYVEAFRVAGYR